MSRPDEVFELTQKKLNHARNFFKDEDMEETIHYIWVVFENCINIVKDLKNNKPTHEHKEKVVLFEYYYSIGILKKNYAPSFDRLIKLRVRADFGAYSWTPQIPEKDKVEQYLLECEELFEETRQHMEEGKKK